MRGVSPTLLPRFLSAPKLHRAWTIEMRAKAAAQCKAVCWLSSMGVSGSRLGGRVAEKSGTRFSEVVGSRAKMDLRSAVFSSRRRGFSSRLIWDFVERRSFQSSRPSDPDAGVGSILTRL